jgi:hypothetical protein
MDELPKIRIGRKTYYLDARLGEIRNVNNPHDREKLEGSPEFYLKTWGVAEITRTGRA